MNIKNLNNETIDTANKVTRRSEAAGQTGMALSKFAAQTKPIPQNNREMNREEVEDIVGRLNEGVRDIHERMTFSYNEKTQRIIVRVLKNETNEVVREIPSREVIKLLEHIQDFIGMLVDESR